MEQQPFYIGQKVVCIATSMTNAFGQRVVKGSIYIITDCRRCSCGEWSVTVEGIEGRGKYSSCPRCIRIMDNNGGHAFISAHRFAPLNPPRVSAIPELLTEPVEERVDHHQPVKILTDG